MDKDYLGDSVYAEIEADMIRLSTNDGIVESNTIYLEPDVLEALIRYAVKHKFLPQPANKE